MSVVVYYNSIMIVLRYVKGFGYALDFSYLYTIKTKKFNNLRRL